MGRIKQRGKAGAAKAYVTRSSAIKKLQCSLADFRRLCILKGIFPREPKNRKKANKGSSAPTSFYYAKDIAYLAHEPVLRKLREHKAFAKKLARALGRGEWSSAKSLEDNKPVYQLDHIIKERYPTFIDALRDIDDALCLVSLFASLPSASQLPPSLIENCARLSAEWQLYVMHTRGLRKVFLSIKGVYFQADVMDQNITWLVPYQFTQSIPTDVDVRVMLTFLELYQTLLGFVFFKLYTDAGLVYPPPLDADKDAAGAGVGAFSLQEADRRPTATENGSKEVEVEGKRVLGKDVRQTIKTITMEAPLGDETSMPLVTEDVVDAIADGDFVPQPSKTNPEEAASLTTLQTLSTLPQSTATKLFAAYTFFLSRETPRPLFEFIVRSFGGRLGWPATSGSGSPFDDADESITHVIIDRPVIESANESVQEKERRRKRKYVQPQWVVDCVNAGRILPEDPYLQGRTLPPHFSPFGEEAGAYDPTQAAQDAMEVSKSEDEDESVQDLDAEDVVESVGEKASGKATLDAAVARAAADPEQLRAAELEAEVQGVDFGVFEKNVNKAAKKKAEDAAALGGSKVDSELDMNKMMMSRKQKKLYEKMKYSENKRTTERAQLEQKKQILKKEKKKLQKS
ncbi:Pescadillo N-terminus-domain-containing protein [Phellopilus nigrolimitatus]|nr:Pescadillo N-terminus-domain-containing protein [Phellopilus nigrolimitatus]